MLFQVFISKHFINILNMLFDKHIKKNIFYYFYYVLHKNILFNNYKKI